MATLTAFDFNEPAFVAYVNNTNGPVAGMLETWGDILVDVSRDYVGTLWPGGPSYPPQPFKRSGDLQRSIRAERPRVVDGVIQVQLVADAVHRGWAYPFLLREGVAPLKGPYQFIDLSVV